MTPANTLQVKYSPTTFQPETLAPGEPAWSKARQALFIGEDDGTVTLIIMAGTMENLHQHFLRLHGDAAAIETLLDPALTKDRQGEWFQNPTHQTQFQTLLHLPMFVHALIETPGVLDILAQDPAATTILAHHADALRIVTESPDAMRTLWASDIAADALWTSPTARLAVWNSDIALSALQATPAQIQRQISRYKASSASTAQAELTLIEPGRKVILLRRYYSANTNDALQWDRTGQSDALMPTGYRLNSGVSPARGRTTTYGNSGLFPNANDANSNVVCALNGLRRNGSPVTATLNLHYLIV